MENFNTYIYLYIYIYLYLDTWDTKCGANAEWRKIGGVKLTAFGSSVASGNDDTKNGL